eukprot:gb/GEZJ01000529.1/.p1 GENE.gb/GEZJ01000529.1/~~gb/GEZJ01000529.1/.p1  ORF type:complete len:1060 (-),score=182.42 gb/GEZJ01000529.1/:135-3314(-)
MDAHRSSASSLRDDDREQRKLPHTLSFLNNVQNAIAAIEHRLEHNPSAHPPPPQRNEYPAHHGNNRDDIYTATVKHLEPPVMIPQHNSASDPPLSSAQPQAVLSRQSTFSSLGIDEAVSVTSDYNVSATSPSPVQRFGGSSTTRSIADIVQHFESNTTNRMSADGAKHPSSTSIAPIVHRLDAEQRLSDASKPVPSIASIVQQFQRPVHSKSSVSFAEEADTIYAASKDDIIAFEDDIDLSSVGATIDPSEFDFLPDEAERASQRALSVASTSRSELDVPESTTPTSPSDSSYAVGQTASTVAKPGEGVTDDDGDAFEGSATNVDALAKSLHVDADNLDITDESVAHAIETLDTYSKAAGIPASQHAAAESIQHTVSAEKHRSAITSADGVDAKQPHNHAQQDTSTPFDKSSGGEHMREKSGDMTNSPVQTHVPAQASDDFDRAQPSVSKPVVEKSHIPEVESNSRSFTITSTTVSTEIENDSQLERVSVIETVMTSTTNQNRDTDNYALELTTEAYSTVTLNPSPKQGTDEEQDSQSAMSAVLVDSAPINSPSEHKISEMDGAAAAPVPPANVASVATLSEVRKVDEYSESVALAPDSKTVSLAAEDVRKQDGSISNSEYGTEGKVVREYADGASERPSETYDSPPAVALHEGTSDATESAMAETPIPADAGTSVQRASVPVLQREISPVDLQDETIDSEVREPQEIVFHTKTPCPENESVPSNGDLSKSKALNAEKTHMKTETRRTLTPSRIPRGSHHTTSPANLSASSTKTERLEGDVGTVPRRHLGGAMTTTSLSPGSRIMSSRLPPSRASSSGTLSPSSRSAATSPKGLSPLRGRGTSSVASQQQSRRLSLGTSRKFSNDRKSVKLPRVAELLNARNRDRGSSSPGDRLPRGSTFNGAPPIGSGAQLGMMRRAGTASSPVTPNNRPKPSPQGVADIGPLNVPLRRTLSFNNNRRATLSPGSLRGAAASSKLQEARGMPGAGRSRRATLSETGKPPRRPITIPEPFHLTGAELQAKARRQLEEQIRKREEMERRRRVFKARPMPDFSHPSPKPHL